MYQSKDIENWEDHIKLGIVEPIWIVYESCKLSLNVGEDHNCSGLLWVNYLLIDLYFDLYTWVYNTLLIMSRVLAKARGPSFYEYDDKPATINIYI